MTTTTAARSFGRWLSRYGIFLALLAEFLVLSLATDAFLTSGNLLAENGRLSAVIDWSPGIGDPAVETIAAWNLFSGASREAFRTELGVDAATWNRGRGWALSIALIALPYYLDTYPGIVAESWHVLDEVLVEHRRGV